MIPPLDISWTEKAALTPYAGRMAPEFNVPFLREVICGNYRVVYRVSDARRKFSPCFTDIETFDLKKTFAGIRVLLCKPRFYSASRYVVRYFCRAFPLFYDSGNKRNAMVSFNRKEYISEMRKHWIIPLLCAALLSCGSAAPEAENAADVPPAVSSQPTPTAQISPEAPQDSVQAHEDEPKSSDGAQDTTEKYLGIRSLPAPDSNIVPWLEDREDATWEIKTRKRVNIETKCVLDEARLLGAEIALEGERLPDIRRFQFKNLEGFKKNRANPDEVVLPLSSVADLKKLQRLINSPLLDTLNGNSFKRQTFAVILISWSHDLPTKNEALNTEGDQLFFEYDIWSATTPSPTDAFLAHSLILVELCRKDGIKLRVDPENALGALYGSGVAENFGYGGLGLLATVAYHPPPPVFKSVAANIQRLTTDGGLKPEVVKKICERHINELRFCYERGLSTMEPPYPKGIVTIDFEILENGTVGQSRLANSTLGNETIEQCMVHAFRRWMFPQPSQGIVNAQIAIKLSHELNKAKGTPTNQ